MEHQKGLSNEDKNITDRNMYLKEISSMMHTFGDVKKPKEKSVQLMQSILQDQMNLVLFEAEKAAFLRGSTAISHEDVLFLMRKNKMKLKRLLEYLQVLDWKQAFSFDLKFDDVTLYNSKLNGKWIEKCLNFMALIEDCDEFTSFMKDETIIDITLKKRKMRRHWMTSKMSSDEYNEFAITSQASFYPFQKFKYWLLQDKVIVFDLTDDALRIISFLARETIEEIVEMVLLMKMKKLGKYQYLQYECVTYSVRSDLNLNTSDTSEQTSKNNVHERDYSTNTAKNNVCSTYDRDSRNQIIVNKDESFKYFAHRNSEEKIVTSFKMNVHINHANPEQRSFLSHIPCRQPQSGEDNMQEETGRQQICNKFDSGSESVVELFYDFSDCYEASSETNSVRAHLSKSSKVFSNHSQKKMCDVTGISDDDIMDYPKSAYVERNSDVDLEKKSELSDISDTDIYSVPDSSQIFQSHSFEHSKETPVIGTSSLSQEEGAIVDISDTSDHESFPSDIMGCCDNRKSSKRKISPNSHSKKTAHEEPITDLTATDNQLLVAAKNEVEYITPVEPAEIMEAYNLFQTPSPMFLMFADRFTPRRTKLICLAESLSFDLR